MQICITGGSGFIGEHFYDALRAAGHELSILDRVAPPFVARGSRYVEGDIRDLAAVRKAVRGADAVLHLAAAHHDFGVAPEEFASVNVRGAEVLCEAMTTEQVRHVCFYSSVAVYGNHAVPPDERTTPAPTSPYGQSKLAAEQALNAWQARQPGRSCLIMRPAVVFGARHYANMYTLIRQIDRGRFVPIGEGNNVKSMAYVENLVAATLHVWGIAEDRSEPAMERPQAVYNYADKPDLTSREIVEEVYRALGRRAPAWNVPLPLALWLGTPFDLAIRLTGRNLPISTDRMRKLCQETRFAADRVRRTGFVPTVSLAEGIERMVRWYQSESRRTEHTAADAA